MGDESDEKLDRKELFRRGLSRVTGFLVNLVESRMNVVERLDIRPPGAQVESLFLTTCTGCADCLKACPYGSIRMNGAPSLQASSTPVILPGLTPCYLCSNTPCAAACPTGSLVPPGTGAVKIGTAVVVESSCLGFTGQECGECVTRCPVGRAAIVRGSRGGPEVRPDGCTGCGVCTNVCPTRPRSIRVRPS